MFLIRSALEAFGPILEEMPSYTVMETLKTCEIRKYDPAVAVCTSGKDSPSFRKLAEYIGVFSEPKNIHVQTKDPTPISMTAPVVNGGGAGDKMQFILPQSLYTEVDQAPEPTNDEVYLKQLPVRFYAVHTFSGYTDWDSAMPLVDDLKAELDKSTDVVKDFAKLATEHSTCPSGKRAGGSLGTFKPGQMVKEFDEVVFKTGTVGKVSDVVKTQFGYHLLLIKRRGDTKMDEL